MGYRLKESGLNPVEETYMENYGKVLSAQRPEFHDRYFRCTHGVVQAGGTSVELFLFPWNGHAEEFLEVVQHLPGWFIHENLALHFSTSDQAVVRQILDAVR